VLRAAPDPSQLPSAAQQVCPLGECDGSGYLIEEGNVARPCACLARRTRRGSSRRLGTGIPKRFRGVSFDRKPICDLDPYVLRPVRDFVRRIEEHVDGGRGLWFGGDVGTGKTSLAMLVSKAAEEAGRSVAIYPMTRLLAEIKETYDRDTGESYMQFFRRLCAVDVLHLDDLGAERTTEWVLEQLYSIVNERWQDERSIVVTSNIIDLDDLRRQVGTRTVSRLTEICGPPILIMGPDLRIRAGA
jgi:DNA replication protein DnaC